MSHKSEIDNSSCLKRVIGFATNFNSPFATFCQPDYFWLPAGEIFCNRGFEVACFAFSFLQ